MRHSRCAEGVATAEKLSKLEHMWGRSGLSVCMLAGGDAIDDAADVVGERRALYSSHTRFACRVRVGSDPDAARIP